MPWFPSMSFGVGGRLCRERDGWLVKPGSARLGQEALFRQRTCSVPLAWKRYLRHWACRSCVSCDCGGVCVCVSTVRPLMYVLRMSWCRFRCVSCGCPEAVKVCALFVSCAHFVYVLRMSRCRPHVCLMDVLSVTWCRPWCVF